MQLQPDQLCGGDEPWLQRSRIFASISLKYISVIRRKCNSTDWTSRLAQAATYSKVQTTLQVYSQAVSEQKRAANAKVVGFSCYHPRTKR
jgi:hypothetical protein